MLIAVGDSGSIETLSVQPDTLPDGEAPTTFEAVVDRLRSAGEVALLAADVSDGTCQPIYAVDETQPRPIGSDFKLYVLGALADAVAIGDVRWDDALMIRDDLKSLPSGTFQDLDHGTELSVRAFAQAMIATSDNTATDHLIDLLGRDRVEAALATHGHADPSLNIPMLTTRELFVLKLVLRDDEVDRYLAARSDERRLILEADVDTRDVTLEDAEDFLTPRWVNQLEWFASPADLCRAMVTLYRGSANPPTGPIGEILGANPAVDVDGRWSYAGFKGGSEPGVLSLVWYLVDNERSYVYVVNVANERERLPERQLVELAQAGIALLPATAPTPP
jgi:hypothetical protein